MSQTYTQGHIHICIYTHRHTQKQTSLAHMGAQKGHIYVDMYLQSIYTGTHTYTYKQACALANIACPYGSTERSYTC